MAHTFPALNGPSIQAIQWTTECILQGYINTLLWSIVSRVKPFQIVHSFIETRRTILVIVSPVHSSIRRWSVVCWEGEEIKTVSSLLLIYSYLATAVELYIYLVDQFPIAPPLLNVTVRSLPLLLLLAATLQLFR